VRTPPPPRRTVPSGAAWGLGIFVVALLGFITLNNLRTGNPGSRGLQAGATLPPFAMPLAGSGCKGRCDANVATRTGQGAAGPRPACQVRRPGVLNSCQLAERGPVVLAFVFSPIASCRNEVAVLERARARHPDVSFAVIAVRAGGAAAAKLVREQHWTLPVGYDHDGAVADEYAVVLCPTITFASRGGRVAGSTVGPLDDADVERWVRRIEPR
jgi:hypothetical protein